MIITTEDTFSRKSKSSVKLNADSSISSCWNDEYVKLGHFKRAELHMTESDITSNRRRSRKGLLNSTKRIMSHQKHPSATADNASLSLVRHGNEVPSYMEDFKELPSLRWNLKKDNCTSSYKIASVRRLSKPDPVEETFGPNFTYGNSYLHETKRHSKQNSMDSTASTKKEEAHRVGEHIGMQPNYCYSRPSEDLTEQFFRENSMPTVEREYLRKNPNSMVIHDATNVDDSIKCNELKFLRNFQELSKNGKEEIIVFNVHCIENSNTRNIKHSSSYLRQQNEVPLSHLTCDSYPTETDMKLRNSELNRCTNNTIFECTKQKKFNAAKLEDESHKPATQSFKRKVCTTQDSSMKKEYSKGNPTQFYHQYVITKGSANNPTSSNTYMDSPYLGCDEDCLGIESNKVFNNKKPQHMTSDNPMLDFPMFPCKNMHKNLMRTNVIEDSSQSTEYTKSDFCECYPFSNYVNIHHKYLQRFQESQDQGIPHNTHEYRCIHPNIRSSYLTCEPRNYTFDDCRCKNGNNFEKEVKEEEASIENINDNEREMVENDFDEKYLANDITSDISPMNEENLANNITLDISPINGEIIKDMKTVERRKRRCTICRTGRADDDELSFNPSNKDAVKKMSINFSDTNVNDKTLKQSQIGKEKNSNNGIGSEHSIQIKQPEDTPNNVLLEGSPNDFPILPSETIRIPTAKVSQQSIRNTKNAVCGCHPRMNHVNINQKYLHRVHDPQNQGVPHNIHGYCHYMKPESRYPFLEPRHYIFSDCRCKNKMNFDRNFIEHETVLENTNQNVLINTKNILNTKLPENGNNSKISKVNRELIHNLKEVEGTKTNCTFCRTGIADKGELSFTSAYKTDVKRKEVIPSKSDLVIQEAEHLRQIEEFDVENENMTQTRPIIKAIETVEYESKKVETPYTFDIGKNITIQIIPNCAPSNPCCEPQNVLSDSPKEHVICPFNELIECNTCKSPKNMKIPRNQFDVHEQNPGGTRYYSLHESGSDNRATYMTNRDQYRKSRTKDKQTGKWWNCNWRSKKVQNPYYRNPDSRIKEDFYSNIDHSPIEPTNCQRVIPMSDNYRMITMTKSSSSKYCGPKIRNTANRNENILKYMHRLNKNIIQDLLATPCPSSSGAHIPTCTKEIRKTPLSTSATAPSSSDNIKPFTVNQCSQYESKFNCTKTSKVVKESASTNNENKTLYECLRYLTKKISYIENRFDSDDEYETCRHNFNGCYCCCCCDKYPKCCCCSYSNVKESCQKTDQKKVTLSTQSKSVEVIHSLQHCGTCTSKECLTENVCTNTEIRPKMSKAIIRRKCRHCCRFQCCHCCRQTPCCPCESETDKELPENTTQITYFKCDKELPCCQREHITYCCECEHQVPLCLSQVEMKKKEYVTVETKDTNTTEYQAVKSCQCNEAKSEVKSTNTTTTLEYAPITNDELMKSVTLDLCNLGDKTLSKFGVPSRRYPWRNNTFLPDMPNEIYRFIRKESYHIPIAEQICDPTPCLRPEVINTKSSDNLMENIKLIEITDKFNLPNASGDIKEDSVTKKKRCLSAICESIFASGQTKHDEFLDTVDLGWTTNNQLKFSSKISFPRCTDASNFMDPKICSKTDLNLNNLKHIQNSKQESSQLHVDEDKQKTDKIEDGTTLQQKINPKGDKSRAKLTNRRENIPLKKDPKIKVVNLTDGNSSTYMPKPFTTKTGLMSFIPPFRDSFRSCTQVNKIKQKQPVGSSTKAYLKKSTPIQRPGNVANVLKLPNSKKVKDDKELQEEESKTTNKTDNAEIKSNEGIHLSSLIESKNGEEPVEPTINSDSQHNSQNHLTYNGDMKNLSNPDSVGKNDIDSKKDCDFLVQPNEFNISETNRTDKSDRDRRIDKQNTFSSTAFDEIYSFYDKCFKPSNDPKTVMSVPYINTNVADIVRSLEFRRSSTTKSFLHSLVGSIVNTEKPEESSSTNFFFEENIETNNIGQTSDTAFHTPVYEEFFKEFSYQKKLQIPQKILSKTDLISLK